MFQSALGGAIYYVHAAEHTPSTGGVRRRWGVLCDTPNDIYTQQIKVWCRRARASQYEPYEPGFQYDRANKGKQPPFVCKTKSQYE